MPGERWRMRARRGASSSTNSTCWAARSSPSSETWNSTGSLAQRPCGRLPPAKPLPGARSRSPSSVRMKPKSFTSLNQSIVPRMYLRLSLRGAPRLAPIVLSQGSTRPTGSGDAEHEERDHDVMQRDRDDRERVEELVEAEDLRQGVRQLPRVDERAQRVEDAAGEEEQSPREADAFKQLRED